MINRNRIVLLAAAAMLLMSSGQASAITLKDFFKLEEKKQIDYFTGKVHEFIHGLVSKRLPNGKPKSKELFEQHQQLAELVEELFIVKATGDEPIEDIETPKGVEDVWRILYEQRDKDESQEFENIPYNRDLAYAFLVGFHPNPRRSCFVIFLLHIVNQIRVAVTVVRELALCILPILVEASSKRREQVVRTSQLS